MSDFTMIAVVEIKDPTGKIVTSHEGPIAAEGDLAKVVGEAVGKFRRENPETPLMVPADKAGPIISIRHYFK